MLLSHVHPALEMAKTLDKLDIIPYVTSIISPHGHHVHTHSHSRGHGHHTSSAENALGTSSGGGGGARTSPRQGYSHHGTYSAALPSPPALKSPKGQLAPIEDVDESSHIIMLSKSLPDLLPAQPPEQAHALVLPPASGAQGGAGGQGQHRQPGGAEAGGRGEGGGGAGEGGGLAAERSGEGFGDGGGGGGGRGGGQQVRKLPPLPRIPPQQQRASTALLLTMGGGLPGQGQVGRGSMVGRDGGRGSPSPEPVRGGGGGPGRDGSPSPTHKHRTYHYDASGDYSVSGNSGERTNPPSPSRRTRQELLQLDVFEDALRVAGDGLPAARGFQPWKAAPGGGGRGEGK